jgi:hypothetical protein
VEMEELLREFLCPSGDEVLWYHGHYVCNNIYIVK